MSTIDRRLITTAPTAPTGTAFGAELRRMREARQLSQSRLANLASINHAHVSRLEGGTRNPTREMVGDLCRAMAATAEERMGLMVAGGFVPDDAREFLTLWGQLPMSWRLQLVSIAKAVVEERAA